MVGLWRLEVTRSLEFELFIEAHNVITSSTHPRCRELGGVQGLGWRWYSVSCLSASISRVVASTSASHFRKSCCNCSVSDALLDVHPLVSILRSINAIFPHIFLRNVCAPALHPTQPRGGSWQRALTVTSGVGCRVTCCGSRFSLQLLQSIFHTPAAGQCASGREQGRVCGFGLLRNGVTS